MPRRMFELGVTLREINLTPLADDGMGQFRAPSHCRIYDCKHFRFARSIDQPLVLWGESIYEGLGAIGRSRRL